MEGRLPEVVDLVVAYPSGVGFIQPGFDDEGGSAG